MNNFYVYMIIGIKKDRYVTYVGYTSNIKKRLLLHNTSRGAKFTKGFKWELIYKKLYRNKSYAMKSEYKLKKNYILRKKIKENFLNVQP